PVARRERRLVDLRRDRPPEVADVPRLVAVAGGARGLRLRVADDPSVAPAVAREPRACLRGAPVGEVPRLRATGCLEVEHGAQLVLRVAGPRRAADRRGVA